MQRQIEIACYVSVCIHAFGLLSCQKTHLWLWHMQEHKVSSPMKELNIKTRYLCASSYQTCRICKSMQDSLQNETFLKRWWMQEGKKTASQKWSYDFEVKILWQTLKTVVMSMMWPFMPGIQPHVPLVADSRKWQFVIEILTGVLTTAVPAGNCSNIKSNFGLSHVFTNKWHLGSSAFRLSFVLTLSGAVAWNYWTSSDGGGLCTTLGRGELVRGRRCLRQCLTFCVC